MKYAIVNVPECPVYEGKNESVLRDGMLRSAVADQLLYGMSCLVTEEDDGWCRIISFYGYAGYVHARCLKQVSAGEMESYFASPLRIVDAMCLDVMGIPAVSGVLLESLPGGAVLALSPEEGLPDGWSRVKLVDGRAGYVTAVHLEEKRFGEDFLYRDSAETFALLDAASVRSRETRGGSDGFSFQALLDRSCGGSEELFRQRLVSEAEKYLGVQYRWAGRSTHGIDCSGLVSMAYLRSGVIVYRDAALADGFPLVKLDLPIRDGHIDPACTATDALKPGDALYFLGHVAMYLGNGKYIHSTGKAGCNGVVINSMREADPDYRADLLAIMYAAGGLRK